MSGAEKRMIIYKWTLGGGCVGTNAIELPYMHMHN